MGTQKPTTDREMLAVTVEGGPRGAGPGVE
jgi:hypothetical protein